MHGVRSPDRGRASRPRAPSPAVLRRVPCRGQAAAPAGVLRPARRWRSYAAALQVLRDGAHAEPRRAEVLQRRLPRSAPGPLMTRSAEVVDDHGFAGRVLALSGSHREQRGEPVFTAAATAANAGGYGVPEQPPDGATLGALMAGGELDPDAALPHVAGESLERSPGLSPARPLLRPRARGRPGLELALDLELARDADPAPKHGRQGDAPERLVRKHGKQASDHRAAVAPPRWARAEGGATVDAGAAPVAPVRRRAPGRPAGRSAATASATGGSSA